VVSAIRDDRAEVIVNERPLKWLVALSSLAPGLMARLANTPWARRFSDEAETARAAAKAESESERSARERQTAV
jgi:hypothetical protein